MRAGLLREKVTMVRISQTQTTSGAMKKTRTILGVVHAQRMKKTESAIVAGGNEEFFKTSVILKVRQSTYTQNATHFMYQTQLFRIENPCEDVDAYDKTLTIHGTKVNE